MTATEQLDFAPTGLLMVVDNGTPLYRSVKTVSQAVRDWDGTEGRFALESMLVEGAHHGFSIRITARRVRVFRDMAAVRCQIRFDGETEWVGADLLADTLDLGTVCATFA